MFDIHCNPERYFWLFWPISGPKSPSIHNYISSSNVRIGPWPHFQLHLYLCSSLGFFNCWPTASSSHFPHAAAIFLLINILLRMLIRILCNICWSNLISSKFPSHSIRRIFICLYAINVFVCPHSSWLGSYIFHWVFIYIYTQRLVTYFRVDISN